MKKAQVMAKPPKTPAGAVKQVASKVSKANSVLPPQKPGNKGKV